MEKDNMNNISDIKLRDMDMDALKYVLQHCSKEIYDSTRSHSGYEIAANVEDILNAILLMKRAAELLDDLNTDSDEFEV